MVLETFITGVNIICSLRGNPNNLLNSRWENAWEIRKTVKALLRFVELSTAGIDTNILTIYGSRWQRRVNCAAREETDGRSPELNFSLEEKDRVSRTMLKSTPRENVCRANASRLTKEMAGYRVNWPPRKTDAVGWARRWSVRNEKRTVEKGC